MFQVALGSYDLALVLGSNKGSATDLHIKFDSVHLRKICGRLRPSDKSLLRNPPNDSLEIVQVRPIQQSLGNELNPTNGSLWIGSSPTFCRTV